MTSTKSKEKSEGREVFEKLIHNEPQIKFFFIVFLNLSLRLLDIVLDYFFDFTFTKGSKLERELAAKEGRTAQIHRHLAASVFMNSRDYNRYPLISLLLLHDEYVEPEWVLQHDNAYVWDLDKDKVMFSITKPDVNFFDVSKYPWAWMNMSHEGNQVLVMSLEEFHRVAEKLGNPTARVTVMHMTPRSGSTLITHMVDKLERVRSVAEVWLFWYLEQDAIAMKRSREEVLKIMKSTLRYLCRQPVDKSEKIEHVFLKLTCFEGQYLYAVPDMIPNVTMIFNSRMPRPTLKSWGRLCRNIAIPSVFQLVFTKLFGKQLMQQFVIPFSLDNNRMRAIAKEIVANDMEIGDIYNNNYEEFFSLLYMASIETFLKHKALYKYVLLYEDLMHQPEKVTSEFFTAIGEPVEHVPLALEAMKVDSHKGVAGGVGAREKHVVPDRVWNKINDFARRLNFPIDCNCTEEEFKNLLQL